MNQVKNVVAKGEVTHYEQVLLLPQRFQKAPAIYVSASRKWLTFLFHRDLQPSDHLAVRGRIIFQYFHHGIFIGPEDGKDGEGGVVDFGTANMRSPKIRRIPISKFVDGETLFRVNYPTGTCNSPKATVNSAKEVVLDPEIWGPYDMKSNNCEHFAMKCKTGKRVSSQVVKVMRKRFERVAFNIANAVGKCWLHSTSK